MGDKNSVYRILKGKPEREKTALKTKGLNKKVILKWVLKEIGWNVVYWKILVKERFVLQGNQHSDSTE